MTRQTFVVRLSALLALGLTFLITQATAGEKSVTFVATVTGIVCDGCKTHIRESFSKLEGVSNVEISAGSAPGTHAVTVTTTSEKITKAQAIASLGAEASTYLVQLWERK
jgi:copper chaperone CopZ